jgi:hypothetical protein
MEESIGTDGLPAERPPAMAPTSGRSSARIDEEALLDAAERQAMHAALEGDAYAEFLIVDASDLVTAGPVEPSVMVRFPTDFAGLPG